MCLVFFSVDAYIYTIRSGLYPNLQENGFTIPPTIFHAMAADSFPIIDPVGIWGAYTALRLPGYVYIKSTAKTCALKWGVGFLIRFEGRFGLVDRED